MTDMWQEDRQLLDLLYTPSRFVSDMAGYIRDYADRSVAARSALRRQEHT